MHFVEKIDALDGEVVVVTDDDIGVVLEFLDVNNGDFRFACVVVQGLGGFDIGSKGFTTVDGMDD